MQDPRLLAELATALTLAVFTVGIALTFFVADRESPTSRAMALMFALLAVIFSMSGLRRAEILPDVPELWERLGSIAEAVGAIAGLEWIRRIGRTVAPGGRDAAKTDKLLRVAQFLLIFHGVFGLVFTRNRIVYAHGDWAAAVFFEPGFYLFVGPLILGTLVAGVAAGAILRSDIDHAERLRLRAFGAAGPFLLSGIPMTPPWEYVTTAVGEAIFILGSVRYYVLQGRRGEFLERFLSPQVARLVRERGLSTAMQQTRVQLSVVACDLRGFTAFAESAAPEEVLEFLRAYYEAIGEAVREFGGTIKDFAGDGVLMLVGAPIAYPDHARRSVDLARRIRSQVGDIVSRWRKMGLELGIGIGVASGYVTVGTICGAERLEYAAIGPAVNLAARLCDRASPGQILVDQRTVGLIGEAAAESFEPLDPVELKGFARPVSVSAVAAA